MSNEHSPGATDATRATDGPAAVNIGERERRVRLVLGAAFLAAGVWLAYRMGYHRDVAWGWRLLLFPVFYQGVRFLYDYRTGTCPVKAELGQRKMDGWLTVLGAKVGDPDLAGRIRAVSRKALARSLALAAVMTAIALAL